MRRVLEDTRALDVCIAMQAARELEMAGANGLGFAKKANNSVVSRRVHCGAARRQKSQRRHVRQGKGERSRCQFWSGIRVH